MFTFFGQFILALYVKELHSLKFECTIIYILFILNMIYIKKELKTKRYERKKSLTFLIKTCFFILQIFCLKVFPFLIYRIH